MKRKYEIGETILNKSGIVGEIIGINLENRNPNYIILTPGGWTVSKEHVLKYAVDKKHLGKDAWRTLESHILGTYNEVEEELKYKFDKTINL